MQDVILHEANEASGVPRGVWGVQTTLEFPKALHNRAKLNLIVKTVKNSWI